MPGDLAALAAVPLAHPLTEPYTLPVAPVVAAAAAGALVLVVGSTWPTGKRRSVEAPERPTASWAGRLSTPQTATRALAVAMLALAVATGRLGRDDQLENLAPALVVGAAWPLLLALSLAAPVWRLLDPWDALARLFARGGEGEPGRDVWPAVVFALVWVWYLAAYAEPLAPRSVGTLLALYSLVTVAGCLAVGRVAWLSRAEPLGIVLSWIALVPAGRLAAWRPPRGTEALLGTLAGGLAFSAARRSELWGELNTAEHATWLATAGVVASAAAATGVLLLARSWAARRGASEAVAQAAVPAVVAVAVAVALDRNRLFTSLQLLPGLAGDPFGRGWNLLGPAGDGLDPAPLGEAGLLWTQLGVLLAGALGGAALVARRSQRRARDPAAASVAVLVAAAVLALAAH